VCASGNSCVAGSCKATTASCANGGLACGAVCGGSCPGVCVYEGGSTCIEQHCGDSQHRVCVRGPILQDNNCTSDTQCPTGEACVAQGLACGLSSGCAAVCPE
jgi:hypothetical protein